MRLLSVFLCLLCATAYAETDIKVMSFNVRYGTANDGENHWDKRKDLLVETIRAQDPAVLGTQETLDFQAAYIAEKLPEYRWLGIGRDRNGGGEMAAVHYKYKELTPVEYKTFWLSKTPEEPGSKSWDAAICRVVSYVKFFQPATGKFIHFFNTHFDHMGNQARKESAALLGARVAAIADGAPIIVTGDFNADAENSEPWATLTKAGDLQDAYVAAPEKVGPRTSWCGFHELDPLAVQRIDWILSKNGVGVKKIETIVNTKVGQYASDHYAVAALLTLPF